MDIIIENRNLELAETVKNQVRSRSKNMFSHAQHLVTRLSMYLADVNGPKGGKDKQCKVVVKCKNIPPIIVSERQSSLNKAINNALHRAEYRVKERAKKHKLNKSKKTAQTRFLKQNLFDDTDDFQTVN